MSEMVRTIHYDELRKLMDLYKQLHPDDPYVEDNESLESLWNDIYDDPNLHYLIIAKDGEIISSCTLAIIKNLTRNFRPYGLIENVITHSDHREKGYGTKVLHKAIEIAKKNNCYKVMLLTGSQKEETLRFYEQAGFHKGIKTGFIIGL